jgi:hypothetical protein
VKNKMRKLTKLITGLALMYTLGTAAGCATTGALEQQRKAAELDALLAEPVPELVYIRPPKLASVTPVTSPNPSTITSYADRVDKADREASQYLMTPEEIAAGKKARSSAIEERIQEIQTEIREDLDQAYQTCKEELKDQLPPGATGRCDGTEEARYIACNFTIDGAVYGVKVETEAVSSKGAIVAYQQLVAENPALLERIAEKHCKLKAQVIDFESSEVVGQITLDYVVGEAA